MALFRKHLYVDIIQNDFGFAIGFNFYIITCALQHNPFKVNCLSGTVNCPVSKKVGFYTGFGFVIAVRISRKVTFCYQQVGF